MNATAIRAIITGLIGILTGFGLIPENAREVVEQNAEQAVGAVLVLWSVFAAERAARARRRE